MVRLHFTSFETYLLGIIGMDEIDERDIEFSQDERDDFSALFIGCNYKVSIVRNLCIVLWLIVAAFAIWIFICIFQVYLLSVFKKRWKHEATWFNL